MQTKHSTKLFLTVAIFALLFLPQMSNTALAAKRPPKKTVVNLNCLDVSLSTVFGGSVVTVASPPGQGVSFEIVLSVTNLCSSTVTAATINAPLNLVCSGGSLNPNPTTINYPVPGSLSNGQSATQNATAIAYCAIISNGIPTASIVPSSVSMNVNATATDATGEIVSAPSVTLPVSFSAPQSPPKKKR